MHSNEYFFFKLKLQKAFTLIELMIAVAIVAVLATLVVGEYSEHLKKSRRIDAKLALTDMAGFMERYYAINGRYTKAGSKTNPPVLPYTKIPRDSGSKVFYTISFAKTPAVSQTTYQLKAVPGSSQAADRCGTLTLDHLGQRGIVTTVKGVKVADCW